MQYYCQQLVFRHFKTFVSYNLLKVQTESSHIRSKMSGDPKESSSHEYREKKEKETDRDSPPPPPAAGSDSDDDADGGGGAAASTDRKPMSEKPKNELEFFEKYFKKTLGISTDDDQSGKVLKTVDFEGLVEHWKEHGFKNIITMVGAGISTSAGIPDFRSPSTGLYHNLQKYKLPYPTAVFEIDYFHRNPKPFYELSKELYPGKFRPTPCHYFVRLLHEKGLLLRHYTQNIDTLEHIAGIPSEKLVEAHGTFATNHCVRCRAAYSMEWVKERIFADEVPKCTKCSGTVKPDIVFFGEDLPKKFHTLPDQDFKKCDLLIIMGTSLEVLPFAGLVSRPNKRCVRLLINRELVGVSSSHFDFFSGSAGLMVGKKNNKRDVAWLGDCDDGVQALADRVGLGDELRALVEREHKRIDEANAKESAANDKGNKKEAIQTQSTDDQKPKQ